MSTKMIGILVTDIESAYSKMIWPGVGRHARSRGYDLMVLPANNPKYPYNFRSQFNTLYNFIDLKVMDALILVPNMLGNFVSAKAADRLFRSIREAVPVVSLNTRVPEVPSLLIDSAIGIREAVRHFVEEHGLRRIGFLEGPRDNNEAVERKVAFTRAVADFGISPAPEWFLPCDFTEEAAEHLGRTKGEWMVGELDALIAANDYMAVGMLKGLEALGFSVPGDLAIIGFDDIQPAPFIRPPLTTIRQPFVKMAQQAAEMAIGLCEGRPVPMLQIFGTELVTRASCGCNNYVSDDILRTLSIDTEQRPEQSLRRFLADHCSRLVVNRLSERLETLLTRLLNEEVNEENRRTFLVELESILDAEFFELGSKPDWSYIYTYIIDLVHEHHPAKAEAWQKLQLFERSRYLLTRKEKLWTGYLEHQRHVKHTLPLRQTIQQMSVVRNHGEMIEVLEGALPKLGVHNCFVSTLNKGRKRRGLYSSLPAKSHMIMVYRDGKPDLDVSTEYPITYRTLDFWPEDCAPESSGRVWAAGPLFQRDTLYGFMISELVDFDSGINESLRHQVSITMHSCHLNTEREKAEAQLRQILGELEQHNRQLRKESLVDEMTGLLNRRGFMKQVKELSGRRQHRSSRFALFFADMDGLKEINDTHGHAEGDRAIKDMARIFLQMFRTDDVIARLGGDEFTAFTLNVPEDFQERLEQRFEQALEAFNRTKRRPFHLSFSVGCVMDTIKGRGLALPKIMKLADERLYHKKRAKKRRR